MITAKAKTCSGCGEQKLIWKNSGRDKYCKECWYKIQPPKGIAPPTKRPNPISKKMQSSLKEYKNLRSLFMIGNPVCQAKLVGCMGDATDVHHKAGRGENLLKLSTWLAVCRKCHQWIEEHPLEAKELGFSDSRLN